MRGYHHARFFDGVTPVHIISKTFQGRMLLRPCQELNAIILGVIGRARQNFPDVKLFAFAFMSNHMHLIASGPTSQVPAFVGFIKREISRRWNRHESNDWNAPMWQQYVHSALPTAASQIQALKYVLSQGTKENLVLRPEDWPGVLCIHQLAYGTATQGTWLNASGYGRACRLQSRNCKPVMPEKTAYEHTYPIELDTLPALAELSNDEHQRYIQALAREIENDARVKRQEEGKTAVLGADAVQRGSLHERGTMPKLPWWEQRRRMILWAEHDAPESREYLRAYWAFQRAYREASSRYAAGELAHFPPNCFWPSVWRA